MIIDPHSAVGVHAARQRAWRASPATPVVALGTAHPAKFPDAVEAATGVRPALPESLSDLMERREAIVVLPNDGRAVGRLPASDRASRGVSVRITSLPSGARRRHRDGAPCEDGGDRRVRRRGIALRARGRARALAFHRAYGVQGHARPKRPRDRRDDRERRRRPQRGDRASNGRAISPAFWGATRISRSTSSATFSPNSVFDARGARAREECHHPGDRRGRGHAGRPGVRSSHRDRLAGPADRPADPRHAARASGPSTGRRSTAISTAATAPARPWSSPPARSSTIISSTSLSPASKRSPTRPRPPKREPPIAAARPSVQPAPRADACRGRLRGPRSAGAPDHDAAQVFAAAAGGGMSSRLFQEVREKRGLAYSIYGFHWDFIDTGLFGFYAGSADGDVARGRRGVARLPWRGRARARGERKFAAPRRR